MLEAEPESAFATEALRHVTEALDHMAEALLEHRESIRHPDPVRAVRFALLSATSAIHFASAGVPWLWKTALPLSDKVFAAELTRQSLAYLRRKP